jgi:hypothetical protein
MRVKLKKAIPPNSQVDAFIGKVLDAAPGSLPTILANFKWAYDKV